MKVILSESYMSLGEAGVLVEVRPGYARNFLLPQRIAVTATRANIKRFEEKSKELATKKEKERENSKKLHSVLEKMELVLKKKVSDEGKLFGSVTTKDLEDQFVKTGAQVDRRQIVLGRQIRMVGDYKILVKLVGGLKANVTLKVVSEAPPKVGADQPSKVEVYSAKESSKSEAPAKKRKKKTDETEGQEAKEE